MSEFARGLCSDSFRRRIGGDELGVIRLELAQSLHQAIVFGVRDGRRTEHKIAVVVLFDLPTKLLDLRNELPAWAGHARRLKRGRTGGGS